jgi:CRISPR system Cascade subunit CasE
MYLSRLVLNPRSRLVRHDLADCQSLHRTVLSSFPIKSDGVGAREEFGVLHRLEPSRRGAAPVLLVQSAEAPDWSRLPPDYLAPSATSTNPAAVPLRSFLDSLQQGERLRFRLRANPTKKVDTKSGPNGERRNGRRVKLKTEAEQIAWLQRKASEGSFEVLAVKTSADSAALDVIDEGHAKGWRPGADGRLGHLTFGTVLYDGHLRIIDPEVFRRTLERGLGSGKAYGFGLLSVGRTAGLENK